MGVLITILIISCSSFALSYSQHKKEREPFSDAELQQIRDRLPCLRPGITVKEAFDLLGVDIIGRFYALRGSGPWDDYRDVYQLTDASNEHGYNLIMVSDGGGKFKRAEIACWADHPKCQEDNLKAKENPKECPTPTTAPNKSGMKVEVKHRDLRSRQSRD
jgi:hypothetical protein